MKKNQSNALCGQCDRESQTGCDVVSLSEARTPGHLDAITEHLIELLKQLYDSSIAVHNQMISRSRVSVLSELTLELNIYFDLVPSELRSSVLTPFAIYGRSASRIYGKEVLQQRNRRAVSDRESADLLARLQEIPYQIWCYHHHEGGRLDHAHPLVGPAQSESIPIAGVLTRAGGVTRESGYYSGWPLHFEGFWFLVCGHEHEERTVEIVQRKAERIEAASVEEFWNEFELPMVHLLVDPLGSRYRSTNPGSVNSLWRDEYKPSHLSILNRVREGIVERLTTESPITPHAQLAEIAKCENERQAFIESVNEELENVLLASRGIRSGEKPVEIVDILALYHMTNDGTLKGTEGILQHPIAVLLLDDDFYSKAPFDHMSPIRDGLKWANAQSAEHPGACAFLAAWQVYQSEQFWLATHGFAVGSVEPSERSLQNYGGPGYLSDIHCLFDERFHDTRVDQLPIASGSVNRFIRGYAETYRLEKVITVRDLPDRDYKLQVRGVGGRTAADLIVALLEHGRKWRWELSGLDYRNYCDLKDSADSDAAVSLLAGLDELADLFG